MQEKSKERGKKALIAGLLLVSFLITQALASPHHIIISKNEYSANPGQTITIPFEIFFEEEQQATIELYGDKVKGWGCSLHSSKSIGTKGESVSCYILVPIPADAGDGTYGLILQDKDATGQVTSRVSIFIKIGEGGAEVNQKMHFYDGWIAYENFPREVELPAHNVDVVVGWRCLDGGSKTYKIMATLTYPDGYTMNLFSVDFKTDGSHTYPLGLSGWYVGGTYKVTIKVGNITNYNPSSPWDIGELIEQREIIINVYCPGSENAILLDSLVLNSNVSAGIDTNTQAEAEAETEAEVEEASSIPEQPEEPKHWIVMIPAFSRARPWLKIFPI